MVPKIGQFTIKDKIEEGNYSVVYKVEDSSKSVLALKIARENLSENNELITREFQVLSQFKHPNIVRVHDYDRTPDGLAYFTLEYVEGKPVNQCFHDFCEDFAYSVIQVIHALGAFHNRGFIHGDLKPEHIIYNSSIKKIVLIDFGFAGISAQKASSRGTLGYIAPEIMKGLDADQRSDLFSLGVIIYEILSGKRPDKSYIPIKKIPEQINGIIARLLTEEPALRPTAPELFQTFIHYLPEPEISIPSYNVRLPLAGFVANREIMEKLNRMAGETVIINGDLGSGKTRLLKELKYELLSRNHEGLFYFGRQDGLFHNALCEFIDHGNLGFSDKEDRFQIYAEITEKLLEFSRGKSLFIMVDDLDELSDFEIGMFRYIGHSLRDTSISLIAAAKPCSRTKDLNFLELNLHPFSIEEVQLLIDRTFFLIESKPDKKDLSDFVRWIHQHSGGNPLFIIEILKALFDQKILSYVPGRWVVDTQLLRAAKIPEKIDGILSPRIKSLNHEELYLLQVLSLVDYPLELPILQAIMTSSVNINLEILKILGLVREDWIDSSRFFAPANKIIKIIIEQGINQEEARSIIARIISAFETNVQPKDDRQPILAQLCETINENKKAYRYYLLSALNAESITDRKQAITYYEKVFSYCADFEPQRKSEFLLKLGDLHLTTSNNRQAIEYYQKVAEDPMPGTKTQMLFNIGKAYSNMGENKTAIQYFKDALSETIDNRSKDYANINNRFAYCSIQSSNFEKAEKALNESMKIARELKAIETEAETLYYQGTLEWFRGEFEKGMKICRELLSFCEKHKLDKQSAYAANLLSSFYMQAGNIEQGLKYIELAVKWFEKIKNPNALIPALNNKALLLSQSGDISKAQRMYENSLEMCFRIGNKAYQYTALAGIAGIFEETGKFEKAIEYYEKALEIQPDFIYANYVLSMIYYKKAEIDKAKKLLEQRLTKQEVILYLIGLGMVYAVLGKIEQAEEFMKKGLERLEKENPEISLRIEVYLRASQFFYEKEDYKTSLIFSEKVKKKTQIASREFNIAEVFTEINNFRLKNTKEINIEKNLQYLKEKNMLYDYAYLQKLRIESILNKGVESDRLKDIADELSSIEQIFRAFGADLELNRVQKLQLRLYPAILRDYSKRVISAQYLETFSKLADLISSHLGDEDFIKDILDLAINATTAERGALFINTEKGMEFVAGRNIDKKTIKDAGELSLTALEGSNKNQIVFVPDALDDPKFNIRKSVLINQIRSILCIPLRIGENIIGVIYLDSRISGSMFDEQDRDFLITAAKILASVIEKSMLFKVISEENIMLKTNIINEVGAGYLVGKSRQMKQVYEQVGKIAQSNAPVLITGETGTGKGMLARVIHLKSKRKEKKFRSINCGAIPETLLESELFGYKRGAFTGAYTDKKGLLEDGEGGTVLLDEITNTSPAFQAKILEAVDEKTIRRVGETMLRKIDVRFILATNKDLEIEIEEGRFREDLYYRINTFKINIAPLRERVMDIPDLARFFLDKFRKELNKNIKGFAPGVMERLKKHYWDGNVRELQNVIERAVTLTKGNSITFDDIGFEKATKGIVPLVEIKKEAVMEALNATGWNILQTAKILRIGRRTLYRHIKDYNIPREK